MDGKRWCGKLRLSEEKRKLSELVVDERRSTSPLRWRTVLRVRYCVISHMHVYLRLYDKRLSVWLYRNVLRGCNSSRLDGVP